MRYLADEGLSAAVAAALNALVAEDGDEVVHIRASRGPGTTDDEIPPICRDEGFQVLLTLNVKDFGARKHYYAALLECGVHVVVARPGRQQLSVSQQLAIVSGQFDYVRTKLAEAEGPKLIRVTRSAATERSLEQLIAEVDG